MLIWLKVKNRKFKLKGLIEFAFLQIFLRYLKKLTLNPVICPFKCYEEIAWAWGWYYAL